jgi:hypothetical protein
MEDCMTDYVITEEQMIEYKISIVDNDFNKQIEIESAVFSNPVHPIEQQLTEARQQEREKVLDQLERILKERLEDNENRQQSAWDTGSLDAAKTYLLTCGEVLSSVIEEIAPLRNPPAHKEDEPE